MTDVGTKREPEHLRDIYDRYHVDIYFPDELKQVVSETLPPVGMELPLSQYYLRQRDERKLPEMINIPASPELIEATVVRETGAVYRSVIRFPWKEAVSDLCIVLEGDYEVVTAYWVQPGSKQYLRNPERYVRDDR